MTLALPRFAVAVLLFATSVTPHVVSADDAAPKPPRRKITDLVNGPKKIELDEAKYYLEKFEDYVKSLKGEKGLLTADSKIALKKISALRSKYPDHSTVKDLFNRARVAAKKLQGVTLEITPAMLAYRQAKAENAKRMAGVSVEAWQKYHGLVSKQEGAILKALPAPSPENTPLRKVHNKYVVLEGVKYPDDLFRQFGRQYIAVGKPSTGYYFVDVSAREFIGAYEAVRRYQRRVTDDLPAAWTVVGKIVSVQVMVPEPGEVKVGSAYAGWMVQPEAIYVPGKVFAIADGEHDEGGRFAGEDRMAEILADQFSVRKVPTDVKPKQLVTTLITALKERNYELYLDCIDPAEQQTLTQKEWLERKYDIFQRRLSNDYVHVEVYKADPVKIIQGGESAEDENLLAEFLDEKTIETEKKHRLPRVEEQRLWLHLYDETGKVREAPKALTLRRQADVKGNRWFVSRGFPF